MAMHVFLTGATGLVGSAVLKALGAGGHQVTALVRSSASADKVSAAGATAVTGDITDVAWLVENLDGVDGAIHTASPGDASSRDVDLAVATAATTAFAGTGKPYVHTSGIWVYGSGAEITEALPFAPPALTAWRADVEAVALAGDGVRGVVVSPAVVYGGGSGIPAIISHAPKSSSGAFILVGDGTQHWTTVHTDDLADLYVLALEKGRAGEYYIGANGHNPTVRELGTAASLEAGAGGAVEPQEKDASRARLGDLFADALFLDQQATGAKAREELGWLPKRPSLIEEFATGSYASRL